MAILPLELVDQSCYPIEKHPVFGEENAEGKVVEHLKSLTALGQQLMKPCCWH
ncbi:MAG: hypothetical protein JOZ78_03000 [Chroococcidiopsidaceae cyanobacterium CP_BM_ER_R8_30]|nr:hypothetical protein [Chroococcidiopsidaceae cyanobacterium CP_BM_ER_R8_30]